MSPKRARAYAVLMGLAILFFYGAARVRPALVARTAALEERQALDAETQRLANSVDLRQSARLERELVALGERLEADRERLREQRQRLASDAQAGELDVEVSALASDVGLVIERQETVPETRGESATPLARLRAERPLRRWTVRGDFAALWGFLNRLRTLHWQVVVTQFEVERAQHLESYQPPLKITLQVAL